MKIAYIIECMYNSGGMERVLSVCANALCSNYDITVITLQQGDRSFYFPLDEKVHCHDLGIENFRNKTVIKHRLAEYLNKEHFDIVISLGGIDMYYLHGINDGSKKIVWFHFAFNISISAWLGESVSILRKCKGHLQLARRIYHARKFDVVVAISKSDHVAWKKYVKNVVQIPNPVFFMCPNSADLSAKSVISVGRLDIQKGYHYLIESWRIVTERHPSWRLDIYGEGNLRSKLQSSINSLHLDDCIKLCGSSTDIASKYLDHSIYVSSSITEAFSLVLVEASTCGLPLVAFDCPTGPRDIIEDGKNGFLIKQVGDIEGMANAICKLIEDTELRRQMGAKAQEMVQRFSIGNIKNQWMKMFNEILL